MTQHTYDNPWHRPGKSETGPAIYITDATPAEYRGYLIFQRIRGAVWDVVKDGTCVAQRAGFTGALAAVDELATKNQTEAA